MPTLKQLTCSLEWESTSVALQEYQTTYSDGYVETYIVVPDNPTPFSIHLQSNGYIAPGLSMFVYMDGVYQCNRLRRNLRMPEEDSPKHHTEIDFRVRQKEQILSKGRFIGMAWNFNRVNIVPGSNNDVDENLPHNGDFVGTIEVVVLRCCPPRTASIGSAETLVDQALPSPRKTTAAKKGRSTKPKPKLKPETQPESKSKTKRKYKHRTFGLDGAWDDPSPSQPPNGKPKKAKPDPWDNWSFPPLSTDDPGNKDTEGQANPSEPSVGTVKMTSASEGIYQPVNGGKKVGSESGAFQGSSKGIPRSVAQNGWHWGSSRAGSQAGTDKASQPVAPRTAETEASQQTPNSMHLRGGGSRTQSVKSHDSNGHRSPLVVNNSIVYNGVGTPPPLNAGPPAARNFWANMDAKQKAKAAPSAASKPVPEIDPWGDLPPLDKINGAAADSGPSVKDKVDNWEATGSGMPGSWDTTNEAQNSNDPWKTSNDAPQNNDDGWPDTDNSAAVQDNDQNGATFNNTGETSGWNSQDQPQENGESWNNFGGQANNVTNSNDWNDNSYDQNQQQESWEGQNGSNHVGPNGWNMDDADNTQNKGTELAEKAAPARAASRKAQNRNKNKKNKNRKPAQPGGSEPEPAGEPSSGNTQATLSKPKGKGSFFGWLNPSQNEVAEDSKEPDKIERISTPSPHQPSAPRSKKQRSPKMAESVAQEVKELAQGVEELGGSQDQPSLSILTAPGAKPYWSTWNSEETLPTTEAVDVDEDVEAPVYDIPADVAERNKLSHQIRPSVPTKYSHKITRPKYLDTHENPYAVFVFHYRDREIVEQVLNASIAEPEQDEKSRLLTLPKDLLVDELIKAKSQDSSNGTSGSRKSRDSKATYKSNPWGVTSGPNASVLTEKLSKLEGSKAPTPERIGGWLNTANEATNGGDSWVETNDHDANGDNGGVDSWENWGNFNHKKDENEKNEAWDNNKDTTAPDDAWNPPGDTTEGDTWGNDYNNQKSADNNDTRWDNGDNSWNNNEDHKNGSDTANDKNGDDWATSGFDGIDTSWNDGDKKDERKDDNNNNGGDSWGFGNSGGGGGAGSNSGW